MGCAKCKFEGKIYSPLIEDYVICDCMLQGAVDERKVKIDNTDFLKNESTGDEIVRRVLDARQIIPKNRLSDNFSISIMDERAEQFKRQGTPLIDYDKYRMAVSYVFGSISTNKDLGRSFILGAPNGMCKNTLANTCIKIMAKQGKEVVPYISLLDLYDLQVLHRVKMKGIDLDLTYKLMSADSGNSYFNNIDYIKEIEENHEYSYGDYKRADVIFLSLSGNESTGLCEFQALNQILSERSKKYLSTVVMIDYGLHMYGNEYISKVIRSELVTKEKTKSVDKLMHVACFPNTRNNK